MVYTIVFLFAVFSTTFTNSLNLIGRDCLGTRQSFLLKYFAMHLSKTLIFSKLVYNIWVFRYHIVTYKSIFIVYNQDITRKKLFNTRIFNQILNVLFEINLLCFRANEVYLIVLEC